jgi:lycopene cyclase domain-containing protein
MTYWSLNLPFLAVAAVVAVAAILARRSPSWRWVGLTAVGVLLLTVIFDNVLVGTGIVGYDPALISGVLIGVAPIEDFAYAIAAIVMLPALWHLLTPNPNPKPQKR